MRNIFIIIFIFIFSINCIFVIHTQNSNSNISRVYTDALCPQLICQHNKPNIPLENTIPETYESLKQTISRAEKDGEFTNLFGKEITNVKTERIGQHRYVHFVIDLYEGLWSLFTIAKIYYIDVNGNTRVRRIAFCGNNRHKILEKISEECRLYIKKNQSTSSTAGYPGIFPNTVYKISAAGEPNRQIERSFVYKFGHSVDTEFLADIVFENGPIKTPPVFAGGKSYYVWSDYIGESTNLIEYVQEHGILDIGRQTYTIEIDPQVEEIFTAIGEMITDAVLFGRTDMHPKNILFTKDNTIFSIDHETMGELFFKDQNKFGIDLPFYTLTELFQQACDAVFYNLNIKNRYDLERIILKGIRKRIEFWVNTPDAIHKIVNRIKSIKRNYFYFRCLFGILDPGPDYFCQPHYSMKILKRTFINGILRNFEIFKSFIRNGYKIDIAMKKIKVYKYEETQEIRMLLQRLHSSKRKFSKNKESYESALRLLKEKVDKAKHDPSYKEIFIWSIWQSLLEELLYPILPAGFRATTKPFSEEQIDKLITPFFSNQEKNLLRLNTFALHNRLYIAYFIIGISLLLFSIYIIITAKSMFVKGVIIGVMSALPAHALFYFWITNKILLRSSQKTIFIRSIADIIRQKEAQAIAINSSI